MIRFMMENNKGTAIIFDDVGSEDGWVFEYNYINHKFLLWGSAERHALEESPSRVFDTLEEVYQEISKYT